MQREDFGLDKEFAHAAVDDLAVLRTRIQDSDEIQVVIVQRVVLLITMRTVGRGATSLLRALLLRFTLDFL